MIGRSRVRGRVSARRSCGWSLGRVWVWGRGGKREWESNGREEELAEGRGKWRREEGSSGGRYGVAERLGRRGEVAEGGGSGGEREVTEGRGKREERRGE